MAQGGPRPSEGLGRRDTSSFDDDVTALDGDSEHLSHRCRDQGRRINAGDPAKSASDPAGHCSRSRVGERMDRRGPALRPHARRRCSGGWFLARGCVRRSLGVARLPGRRVNRQPNRSAGRDGTHEHPGVGVLVVCEGSNHWVDCGVFAAGVEHRGLCGSLRRRAATTASNQGGGWDSGLRASGRRSPWLGS